MKTLLFTLISSLLLVAAYGQTNISGGIYSDTTWTLVNSPYIIIDSVVVFPGVTLTIEPGVVVKFDSNKTIEVRQANIFAEGTITDSITFTSNSVSPAAGMYTFKLNNYQSQTVSKFNYCNFHYAKTGLSAYGCDTLIVRNSNCSYNNVGLDPEGSTFVWIDSCNISNNTDKGVYKPYGTLNNCTISYNQTGVFSPGGTIQNCTIEYNQIGLNVANTSILSSKIKYNQTGVISLDTRVMINNCIVDSNTAAGIIISDANNTIMNSEIKYNNGTGIVTSGEQSIITKCIIEYNITGINEGGTNDSIYCNKICNNTGYDFQYSKTSGSNIRIANNYWCTTDSATIASHIYDGYDNISLGLVSFLPVDIVQCYLYTDVSLIAEEISTFTIYPNPTKNYFTISTDLINAQIEIFDLLGAKVYSALLYTKRQTLITSLANGLYFVKISDGKKNVVQKLIVE